MNCDVLASSQIEQFRRYYVRNRPVILRGLAEQGDLRIFQWSASYFEGVFGHRDVPVVESRDGFLSYERNVVMMPYQEFVDRSFGPGRRTDVYYYFKNPTAIIPKGHEDAENILPLGPYIRRSFLQNLWISRGGLTVGLHFDHADNLNFQLRGEKIFTLYPPGVREYYPMPMFSQTAHISRVFRDGPRPDYARFPRFKPSKGLQVHLRAGDVIYVPSYWWHQVESLGDENVNLNFWWLPPAWKQLRHWNQALRGYSQLLSRYLSLGSILKAPPQRRAPAG